MGLDPSNRAHGLFWFLVVFNCYHCVMNYCRCYFTCMNVQANCADDKEQWVQLLQDGSSTVAGSPYQHTSHESLRYTHTHMLSVCCQHSIWTKHESLSYTHTHTHKSTHILSASSFHSSVSSVPQWFEKPQVPHLKHVHGRPLSADVWWNPLSAHLFKLIHTRAHGTVQQGVLKRPLKNEVHVTYVTRVKK